MYNRKEACSWVCFGAGPPQSCRRQSAGETGKTWMTIASHLHIWSHLTEGTSRSARVTRRCQDENSFSWRNFFIFCGQLERKQVPHLSRTRDIRDGEGVHERLSVWEGERARERWGEGGRERCSRLLGTWASIMVSRMRKHLWISSVIYNKV